MLAAVIAPLGVAVSDSAVPLSGLVMVTDADARLALSLSLTVSMGLVTATGPALATNVAAKSAPAAGPLRSRNGSLAMTVTVLVRGALLKVPSLATNVTTRGVTLGVPEMLL